MYVVFVLLVVGVFGNLLITVYFVKINAKKLKKMTSYHFLIVILAFTDLLFSISTSINMAPIVHKSLLNTATEFIVLPLISLSIWILVLMSIERFRSIVHPFEKKLKKRTFFGMSVFMMLVFTGLHSSYRFGITAKSSYSTGFIVISTIILLENILPLAIMVYFYRRICKKIKESQMPYIEIKHKNDSQKRNKKAMKTLKWLIIIYTFSITPSRIFGITILAANKFNIISSSIWPKLILYTLFLANNIINVFVYARMMKRFRKFLLNVFTFGLSKRNRQRENHVMEIKRL